MEVASLCRNSRFNNSDGSVSYVTLCICKKIPLLNLAKLHQPNQTHNQQRLQIARVLVPQVEQTVPRMVRVQAQLGAVRRHVALGAHHERLVAPEAELKLALGARKVHTATPRQRVLEVAVRTADAVGLQVAGHTECLQLRIVGLLPLGELVAGEALVLGFPLGKGKIRN